MSSISSTGSNVMRITGMASGMDTDAMVKAMTSSYQIKIDKVNQEKQITEWKQEMYRDIIKDIKSLQDYFDPVSSKYILSEGSFNPIKTSNNNENAVGFSATSLAQVGTYKINTTKLAESALVQSAAVSANKGVNTKLSEINASLNGKTIDLNVNGKTVQLNIDANTTITDVLNTINNHVDISKEATASFDELSKKFVFKTIDSGASKSLSVTLTDNDAGDLVSALGFSEGIASTDNGQNAEFTIAYPDGRVEVITSQEKNQFYANGITYSLKAIGEATINVEKNNADAVVNNLKKFIDDYNAIVEKVQGKLTEKKQYDFKPLTDEQKKDMKEEDIKKWESKAKQGILKNDDYLEKLMSELRNTLFDSVYSDKTSSTKSTFHMGIYGDGAIGLDTSTDMSEKGKIIIKDENKLKEAITNNIEEFTKFFIGKSTKENTEDYYVGTDTYYEDGLFTRMNTIIKNYAGDPGIGRDGSSTLKGLLNIYANKQYDFSITGTSSKNTIPDQIYRKALSIDELQRKISEAEEKYYAKFARLEAAMNEMNSQMSSFYSQAGIQQ